MARRFQIGRFVLDSARGTLQCDGVEVPAGGRAMLLLQALAQAGGRVVEKSTLMELAWPGLVVEESNLSVQIAALRKLLGPSPDGGDLIATVPRRGYRLVGAVAIDDEAQAAAPPRSRPSIAVLPFKDLSPSPGQEYFADGITDDIIAALTRFRWFRVAGRSPSFAYKARTVDPKEVGSDLGVRYLVTGSIRKAADKVRVSAELVDALSGQCLWADHHDFDVIDVFTVQDRIALRVAGSIEPELLASESESIASAPRAGTSTSWDLVAQGCWYFHRISRPTHEKARELFREARRLDPNLVEAAIWLARVSAGILAFGWSEDPDAERREGLEAALQAVRMDEKNGYAHYALAIMSVFSESFDVAIRAGERAVELVPSFALGHLVLGMARLYSGDAHGAIAPLEEGIELNRNDPHNFVWFNQLALARLLTGHPAKAQAAALMSLKVRPQWRAAMETMAATCAALGRLDEAREWRRRAAKLERPTGDSLQPLWRSNPGWARRMEGWLTA